MRPRCLARHNRDARCLPEGLRDPDASSFSKAPLTAGVGSIRALRESPSAEHALRTASCGARPGEQRRARPTRPRRLVPLLLRRPPIPDPARACSRRARGAASCTSILRRRSNERPPQGRAGVAGVRCPVAYGQASLAPDRQATGERATRRLGNQPSGRRAWRPNRTQLTAHRPTIARPTEHGVRRGDLLSSRAAQRRCATARARDASGYHRINELGRLLLCAVSIQGSSASAPADWRPDLLARPRTPLARLRWCPPGPGRSSARDVAAASGDAQLAAELHCHLRRPASTVARLSGWWSSARADARALAGRGGRPSQERIQGRPSRGKRARG
jgi:hypothetical protein